MNTTKLTNFDDINTFVLNGETVSCTYRGLDPNAGRDVTAIINGKPATMCYTNRTIRAKLKQIEKSFTLNTRRDKAKRYFDELFQMGCVFHVSG